MTNTPDKSEMKAVKRFERWLAYVKDGGAWAEEPDLDEFAIILALAKKEAVVSEMRRIKALFEPHTGDAEDLITYARDVAALREKASGEE